MPRMTPYGNEIKPKEEEKYIPSFKNAQKVSKTDTKKTATKKTNTQKKAKPIQDNSPAKQAWSKEERLVKIPLTSNLHIGQGPLSQNYVKNKYPDYKGITPKVPEKKDGIGEWLGKNALSGLNQVNKSLFSTLDYVLPTDFLGKYDPISRLNNYYSNLYNQTTQSALKSSKSRGGKAWEYGGQLVSGTVAAAPQAILSYLTVGAGLAASGAKALTGATVGNGTIKSAASHVVNSAIRNPSYWSSFLQTVGTDYEEARAKGANEFVASSSAILTSLINAGIEIGGGVETLPQNIKKGGKNAILEWIKSSVDEGKEEAIQGIVTQSIAKMMYDKDKEVFSLKDEEAVINPKRIATEFGIGTAIGGILGGGQLTANLAEQIADKRNVPQTPSIKYSINDEEDPDGIFTVSDEEYERFSKQVDSWLNRTIKSNEMLTVGNTSEVLKQIKLKRGQVKDLPIVMGQDVLAKSTGGKHNISLDAIKQIPDAIANPIMVFESETVDNSIVILTELETKYGKEVVIPLHLSKDLNHIKINRIASVYGKEHIANFIETQIKNGNLRYIDKNKSQEWSQNRGLYLPKLADTNLDNNIILQKEDIVNTYYAKKQENNIEIEPLAWNSDETSGHPINAVGSISQATEQQTRDVQAPTRNVRNDSADAAFIDYSIPQNESSVNNQIQDSRGGFDNIKSNTERVFNVGVVLDENITTDSGENADGYYRDGRVHLSKNAKKPLDFVLAHELTHHLQAKSLDRYNYFKMFALRYEAREQGKTIDELIQDKQNLYKSVGLTKSEAMDEIAADFAGKMLEDGKLQDLLTRLENGELAQNKSQARGVIQSFIEAVKDLIARIKTKFSSGKYFDRAVELEAVVKAYESAAEGAVFNKNKNGGSQDIKYDIKYPKFTEEVLNNNAIELKDMSSVKDLNGEEFGHSDKPLKERVIAFFNSLGNSVYSEELGDVALTNTSYRDDIAHGLTESKIKAFAAIPEVIQNGKVIFCKNKGADRIVIAAPITISGEAYYMGVMLKRDTQSQRLYLHDVITEKEASVSFTTGSITKGTPASDTENLYITSIIQKALNVKNQKKQFLVSDTQEDDFSRGLEDLFKDDEQDGLPFGNEPEISFKSKFGKGGTEQGLMLTEDKGIQNTPKSNEFVSSFGKKLVDSGKELNREVSKLEELINTRAERAKNPENGIASEEIVTIPLNLFTDDERRLANQKIEAWGVKKAFDTWSVLAQEGKVDKKDFALAMALYNRSVINKDIKAATKTIAEIAALAPEGHLGLHARMFLKTLSPDGQLYYIENSINRLNREIGEKLKGKFKREITLNEKLAEQFLTAEDAKIRNEIYDKICADVARQMPVSFIEKWNSWRYLAMLGNIKTHLRNIIGNGVFVPAIRIKNFVGAVMEQTIRVNPKARSKSVFKTKESKEYAKRDFKEVEDILKGGNAKYAVTSDIESKRVIFKTRWLEFLRKKNMDFLEAEDGWFLKMHYVDALSRVITARKLDTHNIDTKTLYNMREIAIKEALEATYRDANALAEALNRLQRHAEKSDKKVINFAGVLVEGVMPFKKTPANIVKQGINYTPISILKGAYKTIKKAKNADTYNTAQIIDDFAKGLTGTGLVFLGVWLKSMGIISGPEDENKKKKEFDKMVGEQGYSLNIAGHSYTIDWMTPVCLPIFVGAELFDLMNGDGFGIWDLVNATKTILEPVMNLSVFSGISDTIQSAKYSNENAVIAVTTTILSNYLTQAFPTAGGQLSRMIDGTKRNYYYTDKNSGVPREIQSFVGQVASKVPFASKLYEPSVDNWGRDESYGSLLGRSLENVISPGYHSKKNYTEVDEELKNLYALTGETSVFPITQSKYYKVDGVVYNMSAKEYTEAKRLRGQKSFAFVKELIESKKYNLMSNDEKVKAIKKCYENAGDETKEIMLQKMLGDRATESSNQTSASSYQQYAEEMKERAKNNKIEGTENISYDGIKYTVSEEFYKEYQDKVQNYKEELYKRIFENGENIEKVIGNRYSTINGQKKYFKGNINNYEPELQDKVYNKLDDIAREKVKKDLKGQIKQENSKYSNNTDLPNESNTPKANTSKKGSTKKKTVQNYGYSNTQPIRSEYDGTASVRVGDKYYRRTDIDVIKIGVKYKQIAKSPKEISGLTQDGWKNIMDTWIRCLTEGRFTKSDCETLHIEGSGLDAYINDPDSMAANFWQWVDYGEQMGYDTSEYLELDNSN